jgi:hypothetical protein
MAKRGRPRLTDKPPTENSLYIRDIDPPTWKCFQLLAMQSRFPRHPDLLAELVKSFISSEACADEAGMVLRKLHAMFEKRAAAFTTPARPPMSEAK